MSKRIKLPSADELLVGVHTGQSTTPKAERQKSTKALNTKSAKVLESVPREHISTYLSLDTLKRLEEVRTQLFVRRNRKLTKADLIERAIRLGLRHPDDLLKEE